MNNREFKKVSDFAQEKLGIKLPISKKVMVETRLYKHIKTAAFSGYGDFIDNALQGISGSAKETLIDEITTHETYFFREASHFDFLLETALPQALEEGTRNFRIICAGSSSGEEPYSLAMTFEEYKAKNLVHFNYQIQAGDISSIVLRKAGEGVYTEKQVNRIPKAYLQKYFLVRKNDDGSKDYKVKPEIRSKLNFHPLNLYDSRYPYTGTYHFISCRNTLIYFEPEDQEKIILGLAKFLAPNGFLFTGHSESIIDPEKLGLKRVKQSIYTKI